MYIYSGNIFVIFVESSSHFVDGCYFCSFDLLATLFQFSSSFPNGDSVLNILALLKVPYRRGVQSLPCLF